jgi:hypothetical protein
MISRGQMYRQLYMGGGQGITSLDAGAPSIKYTGDIKPQMASAPDPMAELYNIFLDLKQKGQIPKEMGFEQFKQLMEEQSSSQGGIMDMVPREQALFGGRVNYGLGSSFKKAVKKVTGAVKDVVKSDLGKAALAGAALYYGGGGNLFGLQRAGLATPGFALKIYQDMQLYLEVPGEIQVHMVLHQHVHQVYLVNFYLHHLVVKQL